MFNPPVNGLKTVCSSPVSHSMYAYCYHCEWQNSDLHRTLRRVSEMSSGSLSSKKVFSAVKSWEVLRINLLQTL